MDETLPEYYRRHVDGRAQVERRVAKDYRIAPTDLAARVARLAAEFAAGEAVPLLTPVFVWQQIVTLVQLGYDMHWLHEQLLCYAYTVDFERAAMYLGGAPFEVSGLHVRVYVSSLPAAVSLLHLAPSVEAARMLLHGNDIDARDHHGCTALHRAALRGKCDVVELLLANGANWRAQSVHGQTAMHMAMRSGDVRTVELLLSVGMSLTTPRGLLHCALASSAPLRSVEYLCQLVLAASGDVSRVCRVRGQTPLEHAACDARTITILHMLLASPALERSSDSLLRALCTAAAHNNGLAVAELLTLCAPLSARDSDALLNTASIHGHFAIVEQLLAAGVRQGEDNSVAIRVETHSIEVLRSLMRGGVTVDFTYLIDQELGVKEPSLAWISALLQLGGPGAAIDRNRVLLSAARRCSFGVFEHLFALAYEGSGGSGDSLLHAAATNVDERVLRFLIRRRGADPNARDAKGRTPLHHAAQHGRCTNALVLAIAGADGDALDEDGQNPLALVCESGLCERKMQLVYVVAISMALPLGNECVAEVEGKSGWTLDQGLVLNAHEIIAAQHWRSLLPSIADAVFALVPLHAVEMQDGALVLVPMPMEVILTILHALVPLPRLLPLNARYRMTRIVNVVRGFKKTT